MALFLFEDDNFWNEKKKLVKVPFSIEKQLKNRSAFVSFLCFFKLLKAHFKLIAVFKRDKQRISCFSTTVGAVSYNFLNYFFAFAYCFWLFFVLPRYILWKFCLFFLLLYPKDNCYYPNEQDKAHNKKCDYSFCFIFHFFLPFFFWNINIFF